MTVKRLYVSLLALSLAAIFMLFTGCSGGGTDTPEDGTVPPSITSLDRNSAAIGDQLIINGQRFGQVMGDSTVSLNGMAFQIVAWTDTMVTVTVAQGMTSGIVVVTVDNASSTSGQEAQLFIPNAPVGDPVLSAVSPDFGVEGADPDISPDETGDEILLTGFNFGDGTGDSGVYFPAKGGAVSQGGGLVLAPVVQTMIGETEVPQWSNNSIKVTVPFNAESGQVFIRVNGEDTNSRPFSVMPRGVTGPPQIDSLNPLSGGFNSQVTITGRNFGSKRGSSTIMINDDLMPVVSWSNTVVIALIPNGALSGPIRIAVGGQIAESAVFEIANAPVITGISPTDLRVGKPLSITGKNFGFEQGTGSLKVGNTTVAADTWNDNTIIVDELPVISFADGDAVPVLVTNSIDASDVVYGRVRSDLEVFVTGSPDAGEADTTEFSFFVTVIGGSGSYQYSLIPDADNPSSKLTPTAVLPLTYNYPSSMVTAPTTFRTQVEVKDIGTGDVSVADGPEVYVVPFGLAVISSIELLDFNYVAADAPKNDFIYSWNPPDFLDLTYNDFTFFNGEIYFGSALGDLMDGGNPVTGVTRDLALFKSGSASARPYGYRYDDGQGSIVRITGLNLGTSGDIYLNSNGPASAKPGYHLGAGDLVPGGWATDHIDFYMPQDVFQNLSGPVALVIGGFEIVSSSNLICSSMIRDIQPTGEIAPDASFVATGYDFQPPLVEGLTGPDTYMLFVVQADYTDPFTLLADTGPVLYANPKPVTPSGGSVEFDLDDLGGGGQVEVVNNDNDAAMYATGMLVQGQYQFWVWSGSMDAGTDFQRANSGIFSQAHSFQVGTGGGPGDTWSISGFTQIAGFPPTPLPNIEVRLEAKAGFPAYNDMVMSNGAAEYIFTNVPGDADYEVWSEEPGHTWPGRRETGLLTADITNFFINAND